MLILGGFIFLSTSTKPSTIARFAAFELNVHKQIIADLGRSVYYLYLT